MKKIPVNMIVFLLIIFCSNSFAQLAKDSWNLGFGGTYPRFMGITPPSHTGTSNFGAFLFLQRNFSEHVGLRFEPNFNHIESEYSRNNVKEFQELNLIAGNINFIYYLVPCEPVSPYVTTGLGGIIYTSKNSPNAGYNDTFTGYQFNFGAGAEWKISRNWKVLTEFTYNSTSTNDIDGRDDVIPKGLFGNTSDSYAKFDVGFVYYFSKGEPSHLCDLYEGIKRDTITKQANVDYNKIEDLFKKYSHEQTPLEGNPLPEKPKEKWILIGVNFDFGSARLKKESYPVLLYALQILQNNPGMNIEIQGYTDNIGSEDLNLTLSKKRAETVEKFLINNGIKKNRLSVKGFGESNPVADNNTSEGRSINRRIEFKILDQ